MQNYTIPDDAFTQELLRIRGLIGEGRLQDAANALNQAQRKAPRDARVPMLGMRLADEAGNLPGAVQAAQRALALAPGWPVATLELARLLARQGQPAEAMQLARQAMAAEPDDLEVCLHAVRTAFLANQREQAQTWVRAGLIAHPADPQLRLFLGQLLVLDGQHAEAQPYFEQLDEEFAPNADVLLGLVSCALAADNTAAARGYADTMLPLAPHDDNLKYWHAVAYGQTPATQPSHTITGLFDDYAPRFESHLVNKLQYRVPQRIADVLLAEHPDRRFNVLDLGCGTGLVGACLGPLQGYIVGVDLSPRMIEQAARHGIYAKFHRVNALDALRDTPGDIYEAITCADALVYMGDFAPVAPNAFRILKAGGHFLFSCETAQEDEADLVLREDTQRYAHKASHVERLCREAGFDDVRIEPLPVLRMERGQPLPGFLVIARKPAAA